MEARMALISADMVAMLSLMLAISTVMVSMCTTIR